MTDPFFSVIIPLYNKEKYILNCLRSVLNQSFANFEILVIDDGSTDESVRIVESIENGRINLFKKKNGGVSSARNFGIKKAKGQYIAFLDADDSWVNKKLELQFKLHLEHPDLNWSCGAYQLEGSKRPVSIKYSYDGIIDGLHSISKGLKVWTGTVVIKRKTLIDESLFFNEKVHTSEDREMWLRLACRFQEMGYISSILANYKVDNTQSITSTAFRNKEFSFLSLEDRLTIELQNLAPQRRQLVKKYLNKFNRLGILLIWKEKEIFKSNYSLFKGKIDNNLLQTLKAINFLPFSMKKILIYLITNYA